MSKSKKLPVQLPSMELDFQIDVKGEISGKQFSGDFKYRIPNLKAKALADKKRAELNAGLDAMLDSSVLQLHFMIAYLRFSIAEAPTWWKENDWGYNLHDYNVVKAVFDVVQNYEESYMKTVWGDDGPADSET